MDGFELNKILGGILGTLLFIMGVGFIAEGIYAPVEGLAAGYALPSGEAAGDHATSTPDVAQAEPLPVLLANASADAGERQSRKCQACHDFSEGGANKVGPHLYDVVSRQIASIADFSYSPAFVEAGAGGATWTYEELDAFITSPREHIPGTKMTFAGIPSATDRADLLAYLQSLSHSPVPFPAPDGGAMAAAETETHVASTEAPASVPAETPAAAPAVEAPAAEPPAAEPAPVQTAQAEVEEPEAEEEGGGDSALSAALAAASVQAGAREARKCQACHNFDEGAPNKVGPHLYDVVGRPVGAVADYSYSRTFQEMAASGETWTYENLDAFLTSPRNFAQGTKMTFAGVPDPEDRANILAYLQTLSHEPVPFP